MTRQKNRLDFRREQRATLPPDIARNEALLWALLIKGGRPLTAIQRIGSLIIGFILLFAAIGSVTMLYWEPLATADEGGVLGTIIGWVVGIIIFAAGGYGGWRMVKNAVLAPKARS
jgi:hypothetical protein